MFMDELLDPDASRSHLRDWQDRIERTAANTREAGDRIAAIRATARDGNGLTEVTVDSSGALLDIRFTDRIHRTPPDAVARAVMDAVRAARARAAEESRRIIDDTLGPDSVAGRAIADRIANPPPSHPASQPPSHPASQPPSRPASQPPSRPASQPPSHPASRRPEHLGDLA
jgi:DNA-binding protein YbaB